MKILDSGNRREFSTGAVRDMEEYKPEMLNLPWQVEKNEVSE